MRVCHITSAHNSDDIRINIKECRSLAEAGHEVYLVAKGKDCLDSGIHIVGIGEMPKSRIRRMLFFAHKAYKKAQELNCDVYHMHDPELMVYGKCLKKRGAKIIFDSHEDVAAQIIDKYWIPSGLRKTISKLYWKYQKRTLSKFDAVVAATPFISTVLKDVAPKTVVVNNYPIVSDIKFQKKPFLERGRNIGFAGSLDDNRGRQVVIEVMKHLDAQFVIAGDDSLSGMQNFTSVGMLDREGVNKLYEDSRLGVVLYKPLGNHVKAQPIKLFEYMAAGIPVIASDFTLWKEFVEENHCGICVPYDDVNQIVNVCRELLDDTELSEKMGINGRKAIEEKYNWDTEKSVLIALYRDLQ